MSDIVIETRLSNGKILWNSLSYIDPKPSREVIEQKREEMKQEIMEKFKDTFVEFL